MSRLPSLPPGLGIGDGEVAVVGLARSGCAAARVLAARGARVYASDAGRTDAVERNAAMLRERGVVVDVGSHDLGRITRASLVVASPGVPPTAPPIRAAREAGRPVVGEVELALRLLPELKYIAVTGSNGKTTTTALAGQLLAAAGVDAVTVGNIGTPVIELVERPTPPEWAALELSSFQLHDAPSVDPDVGVVTNLSPNHLDRYESLDAYYGDKALLFRNAHEGSCWVLNGDEPDVLALPGRVGPLPPPGATLRFSLADPTASAYYDRRRDALMISGAPLLARRELPLAGDHNVANALAAALAVHVALRADRPPDTAARIAGALRRAAPLPHRIEPVGEVGGVAWINDSKSTSVASTLVALRGMTRPTVLLLGGRHKGEPYTTLADELRRVARVVVAYGESGDLVAADLRGTVPVERVRGGFDEVIARARALAQPGDAVLLSPACSSYDMFDNYEQRGDRFRELVGAAAAAGAA